MLAALLGLTAAAASGVRLDHAQVDVAWVAPTVYAAPEPLPLQVSQLTTAAELAVPASPRARVLLGGRYAVELLGSSANPDERPPLPALHATELSIGAAGGWKSGWALLGQVHGGLAGDLYRVDRGAARVGASALLSRQVSSALRIGGGLGADYRFGAFLPFPLLHLAWQPKGRLSLDVLLPAHVTLTHAWEKSRVGVRSRLVGNSFAVRTPGLVERFCAPASAGGACVDHVAYADLSLSGFAGLRLDAHTWLDLHAGVALVRRFDLRTADDEPVGTPRQLLPPAALVRADLRFGH